MGRTSDHPLMDRYDISDRQHYIFSLLKVGASLNTFAVVPLKRMILKFFASIYDLISLLGIVKECKTLQANSYVMLLY